MARPDRVAQASRPLDPPTIPSSMPFHPLRLEPGSDLPRALEEVRFDEGRASAFVIAGIGSLTDPTLRFAGEESETRIEGLFELLSLSGTISKDGAHLHMSIADASGRVFGGHVCYGNEVRTTAEVLLAPLSEWTLARDIDSTTGFKELVVRARSKQGNDVA
jgi:predicted DNA-binding protein with PD1-like motif